MCQDNQNLADIWHTEDTSSLLVFFKMDKFDPGDFVYFIGCSKEQINWGSNDDPNELFEREKLYEIETVDIRSQHTKLTFKTIPGKFNSVCFSK
jgi:hypothetical protein